MRIVFMGTPDFSAASLEALADAGFEIVGVYTQPDKPKNRGMTLTPSPVKQAAAARGIPVLQPQTLRSPEALEQYRALRPDLTVVVAYGKILPQDFLDIPPMGCINIHGSLLPKYRGAAPIQWTVLNGDTVGGVTSMYLAPEMDTGDMIYREEVAVGEFETSGQLFERLKEVGAQLLCKTVRDMENGIAPRIPQNSDEASYTVQLSREMSPINWTHSAREIVKWIYGLQPWPVATAELDGTVVKIFSAAYTGNRTNRPAGTIISAGKAGIEVACGTGETLMLTEIQAPGKKRMAAAAYLLGHPIKVGQI